MLRRNRDVPEETEAWKVLISQEIASVRSHIHHKYELRIFKPLVGPGALYRTARSRKRSTFQYIMETVIKYKTSC